MSFFPSLKKPLISMKLFRCHSPFRALYGGDVCDAYGVSRRNLSAESLPLQHFSEPIPVLWGRSLPGDWKRTFVRGELLDAALKSGGNILCSDYGADRKRKRSGCRGRNLWRKNQSDVRIILDSAQPWTANCDRCIAFILGDSFAQPDQA